MGRGSVEGARRPTSPGTQAAGSRVGRADLRCALPSEPRGMGGDRRNDPDPH